MENQREDAAEANSQAEGGSGEIESERGDVAPGQARDADVVNDEREAMRRAKLQKPNDEPPEAKDPQVAEIESIVAAVRH